MSVSPNRRILMRKLRIPSLIESGDRPLARPWLPAIVETHPPDHGPSMPPKQNPLNLNPLQLRTLTLLQALAQLEGHGRPAEEEGHVIVTGFPGQHGDHFHLGDAVVAARDASGLHNEAAWVALERKGLMKSMFPMAAVLTPAGLGYDTGLADKILHRHAGH